MNNIRVMHLAILGVFSIFYLGLSGCTTVMTTAGQAAWEDRTTEDQITDTKIHTAITKRLVDLDKNFLLDVSADVWEGRVMLSGTVDSSKRHRQAVIAAKKDKRIKLFYDHVKVVTEAQAKARREAKKSGDKDKNGGVNDFWLETKIKAELLTTKNVTSVNYRWRSVDSKIFIIGRSPDLAERNRVLKSILSVKGVRGVTHHIQIKPGKK
ncbi:MAG: BON domain-containing protein [Magnetococcales bacterium]|nr:BON domain-containing protein [Magnetococcales bacterium]